MPVKPHTPQSSIPKLGLAVFGLSLGLCAPKPGLAAPQDALRDVALEYDAPNGCGSHADVMRRVREALGSATNNLPPVRATISIRASDSNYLVRFQARKGEVESRRTLVVDGCEAATEASTLLLLLTLDPVLAESLGANRVMANSENADPTPQADANVPPAQPVSEPLPVSTPHKPFAIEPQRSPATIASPGLRWDLGAWAAFGGAMVSHVTPAVGLGVALEGGVRVGRLRIGMRSGWIQSLSAPVDELAGASVRAKMLRAHLTTGFELGSRAIRFGPAFDIGVDYVTAEVEGVSVSRPGSTPLISAAAGVWTNVVITGSYGLVARFGALFPLERPRFQVVSLQHPVHQPGPVGLDGFIGLFYVWGSQS
ncbi:MAG: hypothetical protein ACM3ZE_09305 [Myxococcales bacterium]